jgi:hypothetical protein
VPCVLRSRLRQLGWRRLHLTASQLTLNMAGKLFSCRDGDQLVRRKFLVQVFRVSMNAHAFFGFGE